MHVCVCVCYSLIEVLEAFLPVGSSRYVPALIQQLDPVEVQHEGVHLEEPALGLAGALELLSTNGQTQITTPRMNMSCRPEDGAAACEAEVW